MNDFEKTLQDLDNWFYYLAGFYKEDLEKTRVDLGESLEDLCHGFVRLLVVGKKRKPIPGLSGPKGNRAQMFAEIQEELGLSASSKEFAALCTRWANMLNQEGNPIGQTKLAAAFCVGLKDITNILVAKHQDPLLQILSGNNLQRSISFADAQKLLEITEAPSL